MAKAIISAFDISNSKNDFLGKVLVAFVLNNSWQIGF